MAHVCIIHILEHLVFEVKEVLVESNLVARELLELNTNSLVVNLEKSNAHVNVLYLATLIFSTHKELHLIL